MADAETSITELWCYPVKSCAGTPLQEATIVETGLAYDRQWMVVDADGMCITQREFPQLALVTPVVRNGELLVSAPDMADIAFATNVDCGRRSATIFGKSVEALDQGDDIATWFSEFLHHEVRLAKVANDARRHVKEHYRVSGASTAVGFADGFPMLLASGASLRDFNSHLDVPVPMNRFRPNIVVDGAGLEPWVEDCWRTVTLGELRTHIVKPCSRCSIPDVDQRTGERGRDVRKALGRNRNGVNLMHPEHKHGTFFGQNVIHEFVDEPMSISVGDVVTVRQTDAQPNVRLSAAR